jgi:hypothetical protein
MQTPAHDLDRVTGKERHGHQTLAAITTGRSDGGVLALPTPVDELLAGLDAVPRPTSRRSA